MKSIIEREATFENNSDMEDSSLTNCWLADVTVDVGQPGNR